MIYLYIRELHIHTMATFFIQSFYNFIFCWSIKTFNSIASPTTVHEISNLYGPFCFPFFNNFVLRRCSHN